MLEKNKEKIRQTLKICFWLWGTTCSLAMTYVFFNAYIYGNETLVTINDYGEAQTEYLMITLFGGISLVGGLLILLEFKQYVIQILEEKYDG